MRIVRSRAPLRLGIAGGGTDISPYCDEFTGYVLNATIDRYAYCTIEETQDNTVHFFAADRETEMVLKIDDYPFALDGALELHRATYNRIIKDFNKNKPISIKVVTFSDAPMGSGLGASSTLVVSMIKAFDEYLRLNLDDYQIAGLAYTIERQDCKLQGGRQDQYSATFGGFNFMEFYDNGRVLVNPLRIRNWIKCELESSLLLYYTGTSRVSGNIIDDQSKNMQKGESICMEAMHNIKKSALVMKESLLKGDFCTFIEHLNLGWENKKKSAKMISNQAIDEAFMAAMQSGALGGKISGAGGGGFIMFFVNPSKRSKVVEVLSKFGGWTSNCHFSNEGSQCWTVS